LASDKPFDLSTLVVRASDLHRARVRKRRGLRFNLVQKLLFTTNEGVDALIRLLDISAQEGYLLLDEIIRIDEA
jgi:hypothetical protein